MTKHKLSLCFKHTVLVVVILDLVAMRSTLGLAVFTSRSLAGFDFRNCLNDAALPDLDSITGISVLSDSLKVLACKPVVIYSWGPEASVILIPGPDLSPGVAGVDDDGNGVVDDLSELGATGTDDEILTPADGDAYTVAATSPSSRVVSHGAMLPIWSSDSPQSLQQAIQQIPVPAELRIDAIDEHGNLHSRFISLR